MKPGKIVAVDGDLFVQHNISYSVMHGKCMGTNITRYQTLYKKFTFFVN